jgi:hypothetical protein
LRLRAAGLARSLDTRSSRHTFRHRALAQPVVEELPSIVALLAGEDATARLRGITNVCKCTRAEGWVPARVVWEALLPHVVPLAWPGAGAEAVQFEALWTLTNLTSADGWSGPLVALGVADAALATLQQEVAGLDVREQAVWLLGNLLGEWACAWACVLLPLRGRLCVVTLASVHGSWMRRAGDADTREAIVDLPGLETALTAQVMRVGIARTDDGSVVRVPASLGLTRNVMWAVSNVFRRPTIDDAVHMRRLIRVAALALRSEDNKVLSDACWTVSFFCELHDGLAVLLETVSCANPCAAPPPPLASFGASCMQCTLLEPLVACLRSPSAIVVTPALRACGTIVSGAWRCCTDCAFALSSASRDCSRRG